MRPLFRGRSDASALLRAVVSLLGLGACTMVAVGFKAKSSALFLVLLLSLFNVVVNNWWSVHAAHPQRDFLKYEFVAQLEASTDSTASIRR